MLIKSKNRNSSKKGKAFNEDLSNLGMSVTDQDQHRKGLPRRLTTHKQLPKLTDIEVASLPKLKFETSIESINNSEDKAELSSPTTNLIITNLRTSPQGGGECIFKQPTSSGEEGEDFEPTRALLPQSIQVLSDRSR